MGMLKNLDSDIELGSMKQFSASLLVEDNTLDALNWTSEFAGRWDDDRTTDEVVEDIRGARTSNKEIELMKQNLLDACVCVFLFRQKFGIAEK